MQLGWVPGGTISLSPLQENCACFGGVGLFNSGVENWELPGAVRRVMMGDGLNRGCILWAQGLSLNPFWGTIRHIPGHTGSWRQKQLTTSLQHSSVFPYVARSSPTTMVLKLRVQRNPKGISWTCTLRFSRSGVLTDSVLPTRSQMMLTRVAGLWSTLSSKLGFCCTPLKRSYQLCTFKKGLWQNNIITLEVTIVLI